MAILLLAGVTYYLGGTKSLREGLGRFVPGSGATRPGSVAENAVYDLRDVEWHLDNDATAGNLFVVKGSVANIGNVPSAGIRIQATLLGKDNQALAEKAAFAGNVNKEIPPGKAVPFMVIFFDPPGEIAAVVVKAIDAR